MHKVLAIVVGVLLMCATSVATAAAPDTLPTDRTYRVVGVEPSDVLNVRTEPSSGAALVGSIPPDASGIRVVRCASITEARTGPQTWCEIVYGGTRGWVNARYLQPTQPAISSPLNPLTTSADGRGAVPGDVVRDPTAPKTELTADDGGPSSRSSNTGLLGLYLNQMPAKERAFTLAAAAAALFVVGALLGLFFGKWFIWILINLIGTVAFLIAFGQDAPSVVASYVNRYYILGIEDAPFELKDFASARLTEAVSDAQLGFGDDNSVEIERSAYREDLASGRVEMTYPRNYRVGTFETHDVRQQGLVFLWPKNCTLVGCLYDLKLSDLKSSDRHATPLASIRAFNLQSTNLERNGRPVFLDAVLRAYWWDGERYVTQALTVEPTPDLENPIPDYTGPLSRVSTSMRLKTKPALFGGCQGRWNLVDDSDTRPEGAFENAAGASLTLVGHLILLERRWNTVFLTKAICTGIAGENRADVVGYPLGMSALTLSFEDLARSRTVSVPALLTELSALYGHEVEITCSSVRLSGGVESLEPGGGPECVVGEMKARK